MKNITLTGNYIMVSLDVTSLYTYWFCNWDSEGEIESNRTT